MRLYSDEEIQDLTDRVFLLKQKLEEGKLHVSAHLLAGFTQSLEAVRLGPDGRVDPATVDGRIRAMTLALVGIQQRSDLKKSYSLAKIQNMYFDFLFDQFGFIYEKMIKVGADPTQAALAMAQDSAFSERLSKVFPEIAGNLQEFWRGVGDAATYHLQDSRKLKAAFAGDIFPAHWENAVSSTGLYVDTIVLPCPFTRLAPLGEVMAPDELVTVLLKHVLTAMGYRELAVEDIDPPIVVISPDPKDLGDEDKSDLFKDSEILTCKHLGYLFDREFESYESVSEFCRSLETVDQIIAELHGRDRLILSSEWGTDPRGQLEKAVQKPPIQALRDESAGMCLLGGLAGRMPQALGAQRNALRIGGTPVINAATSWLYYSWMMGYQGSQVHNDPDRTTLHVTRALSAELGNNLQWLGNVPPETVLEIRRRGLADEVRSILGEGIADLVSLKPDNYFRTADQVIDNLDRAFLKHQKSLREAKSKKLKLYGIDVPACLAVGGIAVAAAITANPLLGAVSGIASVMGFANLKDIKTKYSVVSSEDKLRAASPTGLMFRHVKR